MLVDLLGVLNQPFQQRWRRVTEVLTQFVAVFVGFRRGYNPDTLVGPVVTTAGDVFGVAFLLLAVRTVLLVAGGGAWLLTKMLVGARLGLGTVLIISVASGVLLAVLAVVVT